MAMEFLPKSLGVVAGGGYLPKRLIDFCDQNNIPVFIIGFEGQTSPDILRNHESLVMRLGQSGSIIKILKEKNLKDLVLIGSIERPSAWDLRPDLYTAKFFAGIGFRALGDDGLLKAIRGKLEEEGFSIHGIHELIPELLMPQGTISAVVPDPEQTKSIALGMKAARELGQADIGQAVVVREGIIVGKEDKKGTDSLIRRCANETAIRSGILVKTCKPQQDRKLDLPTIGPRTVRLCAEMGYAGIAVEAGSVLLVDESEVRRLANDNNLFVVGI